MKKIPILAALLQFVVSYAVNPAKIRTNLFCSETTVHWYWPHFCRWQLRPMFIQSRIVSSKSHNIRIRYPFAKHTLRWTGHSRSFKVILIGASRNPERIVVINVQQCRHYFRNLRRYSIGETANSSILTTPLQRDDRNLRNAFEYLEMIYIARN